ncbi:MAG: site-2 protease family protein [Gemmataceae bacterium]
MDSTRRGSLRLFQVAGIEVYLHWSWFLVAYWQISLRPDEYGNNAWKVIEYVSLFAIVLAHEFGHCLACRSVGGQANQIVLWPLGGIAYVAPPARPGAFLWSIAAGPLVNLLLTLPLGAVWYWGATHGWPMSSPDVYRFVKTLSIINIGLFVFNMLPVYPLDGGQVLQSLLWFGLGRWRSLLIVSMVGLLLGSGGFFACLLLAFTLTAAGGGEGGAVLGLLAVIAAFVGLRSFVSFGQARAMLMMEALCRGTTPGLVRAAERRRRARAAVLGVRALPSTLDLFASRGEVSGVRRGICTPTARTAARASTSTAGIVHRPTRSHRRNPFRRIERHRAESS